MRENKVQRNSRRPGRAGVLLALALFLVCGWLQPASARAKAEKADKTYRVVFQGNMRFPDSVDYSGLNLTVGADTKITLPKVPEVKGYDSIGWTTVNGGDIPEYRPGDVVRVQKKLCFYAVRVEKKYAYVYLYRSSGTCYKAVKLEKGDRYKLPGQSNPKWKTTMGWSEQKGQTSRPQYEVGETITVSKSTALYPVVFDRRDEKDLTRKKLSDAKTKVVGKKKKFQHVVFVGDSRTYHMRRRITEEFGSGVLKNVDFIAKPGAGIDWFDEVGRPQLMKLAKEGTAVIFNIGVHDLGHASEYVEYLGELGKILQEKGCTLFYMSVNPLNNKVMKLTIDRNRPEEKVRAFNRVLKKKLCGDGLFTYIDCYSYLMKNGYGTATSESSGADNAEDDGLHYTAKTYKRIFNYCMYFLNSYE